MITYPDQNLHGVSRYLSLDWHLASWPRMFSLMGLHVETQIVCQFEGFVTLWTMELPFALNFGLLH